MSGLTPKIDPQLVAQLRSPFDGSPLVLDEGVAGSGDDGLLKSPMGSDAWKVINGIPRFVSDEHLKSFGDQWTTYEVAHNDEDKATFAAKTGVSLDQLKGLRVLDAERRAVPARPRRSGGAGPALRHPVHRHRLSARPRRPRRTIRPSHPGGCFLISR